MFVPWSEMAQNSLRHFSTNLSPFQCVPGYQPVLAWAVLHQKENADRHRSEAPVFAPGDRAWLSTRNLPLRLPCRKLGPRFVGTFKFLRRVNKVCYRLQLPRLPY